MIEELYHQYYRLFWKRAYDLTGNADQAADLVHDAFCKALKAGYKHTESLPTWLYRIVTNLSIDARRRAEVAAKHHIGASFEDLEPYVETEGGLDALEEQEERLRIVREVQARIAELPPRMREAILLYMAGMKGKEAAQRMGKHKATYQEYVYEAKRLLRKSLEGTRV